MRNKFLKKFLIIVFLLLIPVLVNSQPEPLQIPDISINFNNNEGFSTTLTPTLEIFLIITVLSIAPSLLMLLTSFTRIVIVLGFTRQALGTRQAPPNQVLVALALFLTIMIMFPIFTNIYDNAITPYNEGIIGYEEAVERTWEHFQTFMLNEITAHKNQDNIFMLASALNVEISDIADTPFQILIPSFVLSELEISFKMGILIYLPFIIVDMIVASILLSMGMMMIPPVLISLPFKLLLFVLINGWDLLVGSLVRSFSGG
jgi:flagellar biosynthetic protein FliP